jgi:phosphopantothenoylcysteine decarboxylase/phosphopantothenate--cysteine ligase
MFTAPESSTAQEIYPHLFPATQADAFVLVPATADMIARIAHGFGDDTVCGSALGLRPECQRFFCPAMNAHMWRQDTVQRNVRALEQEGWIRIGPEDGHLACGTRGQGRMIEPDIIADTIKGILSKSRELAGQRVLILSGPTREYLDPVRYLSNASSGKMGYALAMEAVRRGAEVDFVTGPVAEEQLPCSAGIHVHHVVSCKQMLEAAQRHLAAATGIIFAAAVADYRPSHPNETKPPKGETHLQLELCPVPDIAATLCAAKSPHQPAIGFALQDQDGEQKARGKRQSKHLEAIVLNGPDAMNAGDAEYKFLAGDTDIFEDWGRIPKQDCARKIIDYLIRTLST